MDTQHPLLTWIEANTTQAQFARAVECSDAHLSDILAGRKSPSLVLGVRMSKATGGAVSEAMLAERAPTRSRRQAAGAPA